MCGIAGTVDLHGGRPPDEALLRRMLALLRHRGPEGAGLYHDAIAGLAHARLSIVDLAGGRQPLANEDGTVWVVCNGEVFNYPELRAELIARGHRFRTGSDSEVIVHLYEERGADCVTPLIGDFAFALWDTRTRRLLLARDRLGVRPLFYTMPAPGDLRFASEIKALFADPSLPRRLDLHALDQTFTYWAPLPGRTMFAGVHELPPAHVLVAEQGRITTRRYWRLRVDPEPRGRRPEVAYAEELRALLVDATRLRLRADVPVGAYLSGGLDSSAITAIVHRYTGNRMETFSVAFAEAAYDERRYQEAMARALGTRHHVLEVSARAIGAALPDVVWHAETVLLRTAPVPFFLLSRFVRAHGLKVVLTGEGADEFLGGYTIFKETKIRRFWARRPDSCLRPLLLRRLYGYVDGLGETPLAYLRAHFGQGLTEVVDPAYSHLVRWRSTARLKRFFAPQVRAALAATDHAAELARALDGIAEVADGVARAQHVEAALFLPQYLLSSQGDRVAMAHAVEGRFPFLDHRLVEFCNRLPTNLKLRGLTEKHLLKQVAADLVPPLIRERPKQPYRAPIVPAFLGAEAPASLSDEAAAAEAGYFDPVAVRGLVEKGRRLGRLSEFEAMALVGIASVHLLHELFGAGFRARLPAPADNIIDVSAPATPAT
ncbi:MAG: asparagine synthase (glutamine-hydrolyzing) [Chloroflexota bacterium]